MGNKLYRTQLDIGKSPDGKRIRKVFYGHSRKEADRKRDEYLQFHGETKLTLYDWGNRWLASQRGLLSDNTYDSYASTVRSICSVLGDIPVQEIHPIDVQQYMTSLAGKSRSTISKHRFILRSLLDSAVANRIALKSPWLQIKCPTGTYTGHRAIDDSTRVLVRENAGRSMIATLAALMLYTGMRKEEAVALRGEDIDWENDVIHITKAVNVKDGKLKQTKTTAGVRDVPLLDPIKIALAQMPDKGLLFPNTLGDYMCESTFKRRWNAYIKSLGCEPFTPHDLRYTFATMLYDADVDIKTAQYLLGHSDVAVTMGIYTQLSREKFARGIGKLSEYLSTLGDKKGDTRN